MTWTQREPDAGTHSEAMGGAATFEIARNERPSEAVVRAVARVTDRSVLEIPPLYESVDPDALDALFGRLPDGTPRQPGRVVFPVEGCVVSLDGTEVSIRRGAPTPGASP